MTVIYLNTSCNWNSGKDMAWLSGLPHSGGNAISPLRVQDQPETYGNQQGENMANMTLKRLKTEAGNR